METETVASSLLAWENRCGRKDLSWRLHSSLCRIPVSEILLQQTRIAVGAHVHVELDTPFLLDVCPFA